MTEQRRLAFYAAILFLLSGLTGLPIGAARTGALDADAGTLLGAHTVAIIGALWLLGVAWTLPMVHLSERGMKLLVASVPVASYANWLVTTAKAFLHVKGVALDGNPANNTVLALLTLFVVVPTLTGCLLWAWGLRSSAPALARAR
ncbi:hypothetical protein L6R52_09560 [Myxococcota bacterium]|nr:hypothetical protein [Myxococcota bacterium]